MKAVVVFRLNDKDEMKSQEVWVQIKKDVIPLVVKDKKVIKEKNIIGFDTLDEVVSGLNRDYSLAMKIEIDPSKVHELFFKEYDDVGKYKVVEK